MYVATNRLKIKTGHGPELEALFGKPSGVEQEPGFVGFELWRLSSDADHEEYLVVTHWGSEEDHQNYTQSESFKRAHSGDHGDIFAGRPEFGGYEVRLKTSPDGTRQPA